MDTTAIGEQRKTIFFLLLPLFLFQLYNKNLLFQSLFLAKYPFKDLREIQVIVLGRNNQMTSRVSLVDSVSNTLGDFQVDLFRFQVHMEAKAYIQDNFKVESFR